MPGWAGDDDEPIGEVWVPPPDLSAREVCELPLPETESVLGPIFAGARLVIGGASGQGKTTLTMGMVAAIANGSKFLDWQGCGGTVLIFDLEQGLRSVQRCLREAKLNESDDVRYYRIPDGLALETNETQAAWMLSRIIEHQPAMVVLDPLYKAHQGDSNDERAMVDMMRRLDKWRDELGFVLAIPMHFRKMDQKAVEPRMDDIFGSGGLTRGAEIVLGLKRTAPGHSTLYFWKDRDGDMHDYGDKWKLIFNRMDGFERDPQDVEPETSDVVRQAMLRSGAAKMSVADLVAATGRSDGKVRDAVAKLEGGGLIEEVLIDGKRGARGRKFYALTVTEPRLMEWEAMASSNEEDMRG